MSISQYTFLFGIKHRVHGKAVWLVVVHLPSAGNWHGESRCRKM